MGTCRPRVPPDDAAGRHIPFPGLYHCGCSTAEANQRRVTGPGAKSRAGQKASYEEARRPVSPTPTEQYIGVLTRLKAGDLGLLRTHAGQRPDESVDGFDLFTGLWWPLRKNNQRAPRREVAWLIAKLYAFCPISQSRGDTLARQLRQCQPGEATKRKRFQQKFDGMLLLPLDRIEPALQWAITVISSSDKQLDWVRLTDDLSIWERESTRLRWTEQFLENDERR